MYDINCYENNYTKRKHKPVPPVQTNFINTRCLKNSKHLAKNPPNMMQAIRSKKHPCNIYQYKGSDSFSQSLAERIMNDVFYFYSQLHLNLFFYTSDNLIPCMQPPPKPQNANLLHAIDHLNQTR